MSSARTSGTSISQITKHDNNKLNIRECLSRVRDFKNFSIYHNSIFFIYKLKKKSLNSKYL